MHLDFSQSTLRLTSKSQVFVQAGFLRADNRRARNHASSISYLDAIMPLYHAKIDVFKLCGLEYIVLTMAAQSEKELAVVFDLLEISLSKSDPTVDKSNALKGLIVAAVARAEAAGELKGDNPNQIATDVCITLRHLTGGLLTAGESCSDTGLKVRPYVSVTKKYSRDVISSDTASDTASE